MQKIIEKYEMSYIRKMGNAVTHETENELIILLPVGCLWAKKNGGCSYCGYQALVDEMRATSEFTSYIDIVRNEMNKQIEPIHRVSFFVGGSFLEIPRAERLELLDELNKYPFVREVFFETRPELVTEMNIKTAVEAIPQKKLTVAIGLESSDDHIRNDIHEKKFTKSVFEKAMRILANEGVQPLIYVFVKPPIPNMSDEEALKDALTTIEYSFDCGAYAIELECGYIVENSNMYDLYKNGMYQPLTLWSIKELLERAISMNRGLIRLAYFSDTPEPIAGPKNCDQCSQSFFDLFDEYRKTLRLEILRQNIECDCK